MYFFCFNTGSPVFVHSQICLTVPFPQDKASPLLKYQNPQHSQEDVHISSSCGFFSVKWGREQQACGCLYHLLWPKTAPVGLLGPRPMPGDIPQPRLGDAAAIFPFAGLASSKTEQVSQKHTDRQTGRGHWLDWSHRLPQWRAAFNSSYAQDWHKTDIAFLLSSC